MYTVDQCFSTAGTWNFKKSLNSAFIRYQVFNLGSQQKWLEIQTKNLHVHPLGIL